MGVPWKQIAVGLRKGLNIAGNFEPHLAIVERLVGVAETVVPAAKGADKKAAVVEVSDEVLDLLQPNLTATQRATIQAARDAYIDLYVSALKAKTAADTAKGTLLALVASFRPESSPDATGHP
jgi:hypothetical protein